MLFRSCGTCGCAGSKSNGKSSATTAFEVASPFASLADASSSPTPLTASVSDPRLTLSENPTLLERLGSRSQLASGASTGQGSLWTAYNEARNLADRIEVVPTSNTLRNLEQLVAPNHPQEIPTDPRKWNVTFAEPQPTVHHNPPAIIDGTFYVPEEPQTAAPLDFPMFDDGKKYGEEYDFEEYGDLFGDEDDNGYVPNSFCGMIINNELQPH